MESDETPRYADLSVGGKYYHGISISTLTCDPDSLLYDIFSKSTIALDKDTEGRYIIDRDGKVFRFILNFLRDGKLNPHLDMKEYYQLREEAKYFKLGKMKDQLDNLLTEKMKRISSKQQNDRTGTEDSREDFNEEMLDPGQDITDTESDRELTDESKAPLWFMGTNPLRSPYVPQMGDEVMYFWQGHKCYVETVKREGIYDIDEREYPWDGEDLKTEEPMRVVGLEYHTGPTITCEIKLASLDHVSKMLTGKIFKFRYHVMREIKDFMILLEHYEISKQKQWKEEDSFRAPNKNKWWLGVIEKKRPMDNDYPESPFQCFAIRWNNGSKDALSPWDLYQNENKNSQIKVGKGILITKTDMQLLRYNPEPSDWDDSDQNTECDRILTCLDQIMPLKVCKILIAPISGGEESNEPMVVPYPIKLSTIRKRLETRFYRRRSALRWEVKQFDSNALLFNKPNGELVKSAELVTNILLEVVRNVKVDNAVDLYNRMVGISDTKQKTKKRGKKRSRRVSKVFYSSEESDDETKASPKKRRRRTHDEKSWFAECKTLLTELLTLESSEYFRTPIDTSVFKNYAGLKEPMDLTTVKERMDNGVYEDPSEFAKDIRLIVNNSRARSTDKTSRIYTMTREFSKFFEDSIRETLTNYKNAAAYKKLAKGNGTPSTIKKGKDKKQSPLEKLTLHDKPRTPSSTQKGTNQRQSPRKKMTVPDEPRTPSSIQKRNDQRQSPQKNLTVPDEPRTPSIIQKGNDQRQSPRKNVTVHYGPRTLSTIQKGKDRKQSPRKKLTQHDKPGPSGTQKRPNKSRPSGTQMSLQAYSYSSTLQAKEGKAGNYSDDFWSVPASRHGWPQRSPDDSHDEDEYDIATKSRDRTPTPKGPKKGVGFLKSKAQHQLEEKAKQPTFRKSSTSSDDSVREVFLDDVQE